jgi:hypothetical protein
MEQPQYIQPTWRDRGKLFFIYILVFVWWISHPLWVSPLIELAPCESVCKVLLNLQFVTAYAMLVPLTVSIFLASYAKRIFESNQFPPPGTLLLFRTRLRTGWLVKLEGAFVMLGAIFFALCPGLIANFLRAGYIFCILEPCGCG